MAYSGGGGGGGAGECQQGSRSPSPVAAAGPHPPTCSNTLGIPDHPHGRVRMFLDADVPGPDGQLPYMKLYRSASDDEEDEDFEEGCEEDNENVDPNEIEPNSDTEEEHELDRLLRHPPSGQSTSGSIELSRPQNGALSTEGVAAADAAIVNGATLAPGRTSSAKRSRSSSDRSDGPPEAKSRKRPEKD